MTALPPLPLYRLLPRLCAASRGETRRLAAAGAITVNGVVARDADLVVDPATDEIVIDGRPYAPVAPLHLVLNKPLGVITSASDPAGRRIVLDLLPPQWRSARPVGRLDRASSGLLFFTTDGVLGHAVAASGGIAKTYEVDVKGHPDDAAFAPLRAGLELDGVACRPAEVEVLERRAYSTLVRVTLREGRYRQIRRSMHRVRLRVRALHRVAIGPLAIGELPAGAVRELTTAELDALASAALPRDALHFPP